METLPFHHTSMVDFIKSLKAANFTEQQIEILAKRDEEKTQQFEHILEITEQNKAAINSKELATKGDLLLARSEIRESELRLQKEIEIVRREISTAKNQTIIWIISFIMASGLIQHFFIK